MFKITKKRLKKEIKQIGEVNRSLAEREDHIKVQTNYIKENFNVEMSEVPHKSCRCTLNMIEDITKCEIKEIDSFYKYADEKNKDNNLKKMNRNIKTLDALIDIFIYNLEKYQTNNLYISYSVIPVYPECLQILFGKNQGKEKEQLILHEFEKYKDKVFSCIARELKKEQKDCQINILYLTTIQVGLKMLITRAEDSVNNQ